MLRSTQKRVDPLRRLAKEERAGPELGHGRRRGDHNYKKEGSHEHRLQTKNCFGQKKVTLFKSVIHGPYNNQLDSDWDKITNAILLFSPQFPFLYT